MGDNGKRECPFCGERSLHSNGEAVVYEEQGWRYYHHEMKCDTCGLTTVDRTPFKKEPM